WVPQSDLIRSQLLKQVKVVRGDVRDQALLERALGEYEIDTVIHLAAQTMASTRSTRSSISRRRPSCRLRLATRSRRSRATLPGRGPSSKRAGGAPRSSRW